MRVVFGVLSLLIVAAIIAFVAKKQLTPPLKIALADSFLPAPAPGATPHQQGRQARQQLRQSLENTLQQARPMPEDR